MLHSKTALHDFLRSSSTFVSLLNAELENNQL
jgi:hypothetical protein